MINLFFKLKDLLHKSKNSSNNSQIFFSVKKFIRNYHPSDDDNNNSGNSNTTNNDKKNGDRGVPTQGNHVAKRKENEQKKSENNNNKKRQFMKALVYILGFICVLDVIFYYVYGYSLIFKFYTFVIDIIFNLMLKKKFIFNPKGDQPEIKVDHLSEEKPVKLSTRRLYLKPCS